MSLRIAALLKDRCQPKKCSHECYNFCPRVRTGDETIKLTKRGYPMISEKLCVGCGICVNKCPFDAIKILGLPEEMESEIVHHFGENQFRLYRLPTPQTGQVVGLLGPNGIGKTTTLSILSGEIIPNLGDLEGEATWEKVLDHFAGREIHDYLEIVSKGNLKVAIKPQYVDNIPKVTKGKVMDLLASVSRVDEMEEIIKSLEISKVLDRDISQLSGGELQRVAIAATLMKDADVYFFDEPSSYLDIYQRLKVAQIIQNISQEKRVLVIEHDLAVLDFLADVSHIMYGEKGAYGVLAQPRAVRNAINTYLEGMLKEENVRFRERPIKFHVHPPRAEWHTEPIIRFDPLEKKLGDFVLETGEGNIHEGEVVGVVGPNATGKTTFVQMLAGLMDPTNGKVESPVKISYKPQYIKPEYDCTVREMFYTELGEDFGGTFWATQISRPLSLTPLYEKNMQTLSGGELQTVSVAAALGKKADLYLLDEPSAYLDSNQRMEMARTIRRVMEKGATSALVVDHDVYFLDIISDSIMVFSGESGVHGVGEGPFDLRDGMNRFLKDVGISFRRDNDTNRPRINKQGSRLDREAKSTGEFYYAAE